MFTYLCDIALYYHRHELHEFNMEGRLLGSLKTITNVFYNFYYFNKWHKDVSY
jgi:hypothetical protein